MLNNRARDFSRILFAGIIMALVACTPTPVAPPVNSPVPTQPPASQVPVVTTAPQAGIPSWLHVYFTDPNPPDQVNNGIDKVIVPYIQAATKTIDAASFDFNLPSVVNALADAKQRGVVVRVVFDGMNGVQELKGSANLKVDPFNARDVFVKYKIPVVDGGRSNGLMHNKFTIIDGNMLFVGSWNYSYNDTFRNNNNLLQITSQKLIANYQAKFNEMFVDKRFGTKATLKSPNPKLTLDGTEVENYFSPDDKVMDKLVAEVNAARKSVKFLAFTYTHEDLGNAMLARSKAGVLVTGVFENRGASQGQMPALYCAKLPIKVDGNSYTMHHKVIIIDDMTVITGSFNFTVTADTANDDNVIIIRNAAVAKLYTDEFNKRYAEAKDPTTADCSVK